MLVTLRGYRVNGNSSWPPIQLNFSSCATNFFFFPSSLGYVPHCDMMQFIAMASSGAYLAKAPPVSRRHCTLLISMEDDTLSY